MEAYFWIVIVAAWSLLLLLGLAGGDPLAKGRAGREAPGITFAKWLAHVAPSILAARR